MHADYNASALSFGTRRIDESGTLIGNLDKLRAANVYPSHSADIRSLIKFFIKSVFEILFDV